METCGHTQWFVLEHLLPYLDHILFDLKHMDDELHRIHTGAGNGLILSNLRRLAALNAPLTVRVPLIPGFNASAESVEPLPNLCPACMARCKALTCCRITPWAKPNTRRWAASIFGKRMTALPMRKSRL